MVKVLYKFNLDFFVKWLDKFPFDVIIHTFSANINFITQPKNVLAAESSRAEFSCHANSANPAKEPLYFWKHNGTYIPENNQLGILIKRRTLVINHVNSIIHQGKYQCVAFLPEYGAIISLPAKLEMECKFFSLEKDIQMLYLHSNYWR